LPGSFIDIWLLEGQEIKLTELITLGIVWAERKPENEVGQEGRRILNEIHKWGLIQ